MLLRLFASVACLGAPWLLGAAEFCIGGTVVNGLTGEPLRHAAVTTPQSATLSDAAGAFRVCGMQAGTYYTNGEKPGFVPGAVKVSVGPSREDIVLRLQPLTVIKGKVRDANDEPLENVLIQVLSITTREGRRKVKLENSTSTDDRGEYRLPGVSPGRYLVRAAGWQGAASTKQPDSNRAFSPVYYGGAPDLASASPVVVEAGRDVDADFSVTLDEAYRVSGALSGFSATQPVRIELIGAEGDVSAAPVTFKGATGAFQISKVVPGSYLLRATQGEGDERLRGEQALQVGFSDVNDVLLPLASAVTVRGMVRIAAASGTAPTPPNCALQLTPARDSMTDDPALDSATNEDGVFEVAGVLPGRYRLRLDCPSGYVAAAHTGETDLMAHDELTVTPGVAPAPIEATLNTDGGTVDVTAAQEDDREPVSAWFVLVPESSNDLCVKFAILRGKLSVSNVAPGDYQAYAWTGSPYTFEYANNAARQAWAGRAVSVHVAEREHATITVKVSAGEAP